LRNTTKSILAVFLLFIVAAIAITSVLFARTYLDAGEASDERQTLLPAWLSDFFPDRSSPVDIDLTKLTFSPFTVVYEGGEIQFNTLHNAFSFANNLNSFAYIYAGSRRVWDNHELPVTSAHIDAPLIMQLPALDRGCGVVSLTMLLNFHGINVDKMQLVNEINKVPFPGDPNEGFVGNIFTFNEEGLGVYHAPIFNLLQQYLPNTAIDLTGLPFEVMLYYIANGSPVWIVTNFLHRPLAPYNFTTWALTNANTVNVSWHMHSVLVTGFSETHVYFNDPLYNPARTTGPPTFYRAPIAEFVASWEQFGNQMVAVLPAFS